MEPTSSNQLHVHFLGLLDTEMLRSAVVLPMKVKGYMEATRVN